MTATPTTGYGLSDLHRVPLLPQHEAAIEHARTVALGAGYWRHAKFSAIRDVFALAQISRLEVLGIDPTTELRMHVRMACATPCVRVRT